MKIISRIVSGVVRVFRRQPAKWNPLNSWYVNSTTGNDERYAPGPGRVVIGDASTPQVLR